MSMTDLITDLLKICAAGTIAEAGLSCGLLWLSNQFLFDIPRWSLWLVFGGPPVIAAFVFLADLIIRSRGPGAQPRKIEPDGAG